jgi:hypothetical protein
MQLTLVFTIIAAFGLFDSAAIAFQHFEVESIIYFM